MAYYVYELDSTMIVRVLKKGYWQNASYKTEAAAKAGFTRLAKKAGKSVKAYLKTHGIAEAVYFHKSVEKMRKTRNILNPAGGEILIPVNTPNYMDPGSEAYHSM